MRGRGGRGERKVRGEGGEGGEGLAAGQELQYRGVESRDGAERALCVVGLVLHGSSLNGCAGREGKERSGVDSSSSPVQSSPAQSSDGDLERVYRGIRKSIRRAVEP
jgi:hypothetical protein